MVENADTYSDYFGSTVDLSREEPFLVNSVRKREKGSSVRIEQSARHIG